MLRTTGLLVVVLAAQAGGLSAQELVVRGRVLGPDGSALAEQRVVLHRVDATGGATVAETVSSAGGEFVMTAPPSTDTAALYFVAARHDGELYIGEPFRAGSAVAAEQTLQVGIVAHSASALLAEAEQPPPARGRPASGTSWLLLLVPLLGVGGAVLYMVVPRGRIAPERAALIRIAQIDERLDAAPPGQRDSLQHERARLIERLRAL